MRIWVILLVLGILSCSIPTGGVSDVDTDAQVLAPVISPNGININTGQAILISTGTSGALIRYTIDGSVPSENSGSLYTSSFTLSPGTITIKAIAYKQGLNNSVINSRTFSVSGGAFSSFEAENALKTGVALANSLSGFSGTGYVQGFDSGTAADKVVFTCNLASAGTYLLKVRALVETGMGSAKTNDVFVNGAKVGDFSLVNNSTWTETFNQAINLNSGSNSIEIRENWGWFALDKITIQEITTASAPDELNNPNASDNTKRVYKYLKSIWGSKTLAGQMDLTWDDAVDMKAKVFADTGKYPALMGFDFMNIENGSGNGTTQTEEAKAWWDAGGIVSFCWHFRDPSNSSGGEFYSADTSFRIPMTAGGLLNTSTSAFNQIKAKVDKVATKLLYLQSQGVPVLWRPLHEAYGNGGTGWFWWGGNRTDGIDNGVAFKALWNWLYDYLTNVKGLNNLIWVYNGQSASWYPGNDTVDIIGEDVYSADSANDYASQKSRFDGAKAYPLSTGFANGSKMVALTENGPIPSPSNMAADNARWLWFMTWNDKDGVTTNTKDEYFWSSSYYNQLSHKTLVYGHTDIITRDELPDLKNYPL